MPAKAGGDPTPVFTLIEGGDVYTPQPAGPVSVLLANDRIVKIGAVDGRALAALDLPCATVDATGCVVVPGLIDPHEHLIGAGGEEGFASRTAEVALDEILGHGITTCRPTISTPPILSAAPRSWTTPSPWPSAAPMWTSTRLKKTWPGG